MKNLKKEALPDLKERNAMALRYSKFVTRGIETCNDVNRELAEEALYTLDKMIEDYRKFMLVSMQEGIEEIVNREFSFMNKSIKDIALEIVEDEDESEVVYDKETGQLYYESPTAEMDMDDKAEEIVKECYQAMSIEFFKIATDSPDRII